MHTLNMLEVINPKVEGKGYCKRYINGRLVPDIRWNLAQCHAQTKDCYQTTGKNGKWYHRHTIRSPINFAK